MPVFTNQVVLGLPGQLFDCVFASGRCGSRLRLFDIHQHHRSAAAGVVRSAHATRIMFCESPRHVLGNAGVQASIGTANHINEPHGVTGRQSGSRGGQCKPRIIARHSLSSSHGCCSAFPRTSHSCLFAVLRNAATSSRMTAASA